MKTALLRGVLLASSPTWSRLAAIATGTARAAECLGFGKETGALEAGKATDLLVLDRDRSATSRSRATRPPVRSCCARDGPSAARAAPPGSASPPSSERSRRRDLPPSSSRRSGARWMRKRACAVRRSSCSHVPCEPESVSARRNVQRPAADLTGPRSSQTIEIGSGFGLRPMQPPASVRGGLLHGRVPQYQERPIPRRAPTNRVECDGGAHAVRHYPVGWSSTSPVGWFRHGFTTSDRPPSTPPEERR